MITWDKGKSVLLNADFSKVTRTGVEILVSLALVVLFFGFFLVLLNALFPIGRGLKAHEPEGGALSGSFAAIERSLSDLMMMRGDREVLPTGRPAAVLSDATNNVRAKRTGQIAWRGIEPGATLFDGDGVQTASRSNALIIFNDKNYLRMGENSLVIIRRMERDAILPQNRSVVVMAEGEVWGRVERTGNEKAYLEVTTPAADAQIRSSEGGGAAEFKISINEDKSSTISVFRGEVEVSAEGKSVIIGENQQASILLGGAPSGVMEMLPQVQLREPANGKRYYFAALSPRVRFSWHPLQGISTYRLVLAKDRYFSKPVLDTRVNGSQFEHGNLAHGSYYWRVQAYQEGREGALSETRNVRLVEDDVAPTLRVEFPPDITNQSRHTIRGATEPGAQVFVGDKRLIADREGRFKVALELKRGLNIIVVQSIDSAGNIEYQSKTVNGKF